MQFLPQPPNLRSFWAFQRNRRNHLDYALVEPGRNNPSLYTVNGRPFYVHWNGLASVCLKEAMQARMRSRKSSTDGPCPRFSNRRTPRLNQRSLWFSQLVGFGVAMHRMRWLTSLKHSARVGLDCPLPLCAFSPRSSSMPQARATSLTHASDLCMWR